METRLRWLKAGSAFTIATGLLIAAAAVPALNAPTLWLFDLVVFPLDGGQSLGDVEARLLCAITGGLMTGLGVMIWLISTEVFARDPLLGRSIIIKSFASWFVIDSAMSIAAGAPLNVIGNTAFLLLFMLPVWSVGAERQQHA